MYSNTELLTILRNTLLDSGESYSYVAGFFESLMKEVINRIDDPQCISKIESLIKYHIESKTNSRVKKNLPVFLRYENLD